MNDSKEMQKKMNEVLFGKVVYKQDIRTGFSS